MKIDFDTGLVVIGNVFNLNLFGGINSLRGCIKNREGYAQGYVAAVQQQQQTILNFADQMIFSLK